MLDLPGQVVSNGATAELACNLCGARDAAVVFPAGVAQVSRIVRCRRCGLMYASPRGVEPEVDQVRRLDPDDPGWRRGYEQRRAKEALQVRDTLGTRALLARRFPSRGLAVEVGSGFGYLLRELRQEGWDVLGLEPFEGFCRHARDELGVPSRACTLEEADLAEGSVRVLWMLHVIEHLPDPCESLRLAARVLRPDGVLVVETPTYDGWSFRLLGRRERSLACPTHLTFYTRETLRRTAERAGLSPLRAQRVGRTLSVERLAWNLGVIARSPRLQRVLPRAARALRLDRLHLRVHLGDMQRALFERSGGAPARSGT